MRASAAAVGEESFVKKWQSSRKVPKLSSGGGVACMRKYLAHMAMAARATWTDQEQPCTKPLDLPNLRLFSNLAPVLQLLVEPCFRSQDRGGRI